MLTIYNDDGDRIGQSITEDTVLTSTTSYVIDTATPLTMVLAETTNGVITKHWYG